MARSYHKNLYFAWYCINHSDQAKWKRQYNRNFRRIAKQKLNQALTVANDDFYYDNVKKQNYADLWISPADGYFRHTVMSKQQFKTLVMTDVRNWNYFSSFKNYQAYLNYVKKEYLCK